ncbi:MAG: NAD(P)-dependent oxidoreductase [Prevotella sp.]|nr:NAD(P)-dependent oxidoreductase [Prevotella sp.]
MSNILITGATGFIGGFIVDEALRRNMNVWVMLRKSSSRQWLSDSRIRFLEANLSSEDDLVEKMHDLQFDYVVHAAGVTKSLHREDFRRVNVGGTKNLVNALLRLKMPLKKFVYLSSLSIFGPVREQQPYTEILETDEPQPNTEYGKSKLEAERWLESVGGLPVVFLRPTGVYGPRERDYFLMAKSIKAHTDFAVGFKPQDITFVYVLDVVQAIFLAIEKGEPGRKFFLSDGQVYRSSAFSDLIRKELGNPWWIRITAPLWLLRIITFCGEYIGRLTDKVTALNNDKYHIMKQRNWRCDIGPACRELGFEPKYQLEEGVRLTIKWYKENHWL